MELERKKEREKEREREREREREKGEQREKGRDQGFTMPVPNHFIDQKEACLLPGRMTEFVSRTTPYAPLHAGARPKTTGPVLSSILVYRYRGTGRYL